MRITRRRVLAGAMGGAATGLLSGCAPPTEKADVIVIGAGLAGLHAARLLESLGASVIVLEANSRVGGRVNTRYDADGAPELGAADVGALYARVLDTAAELEVPLAPWPDSPPGYWFHIGGKAFTAEQWPELNINPLQGDLRAVSPAALSRMFLPRPNPLPRLGAWLDDEFAALDGPYGDYLQSQGAPAAALPLLEIGAQLGSLDAESALWKLHGIKFSMESMGTAMAQNLPLRQYVPGGMSRLTDAMAASLQSEVRLEHAVRGIENGADSVAVSCSNGRRFAAEFAICTLPLPALRQVALTRPLPELANAAVNDIPYGRATSVVLRVVEPYWEADGLPPNLWSDTVLQRAFLNPSPTGEGNHLWVFSTGSADLSGSDMTEAEIGEYVLRKVNELRPSTVGRLAVGAVRAFTRDPLAGGTYATRAPGQVQRFKNVLAQPLGRLLLAGEHTAELNSGMEGAMESGERAALAVGAA